MTNWGDVENRVLLYNAMLAKLKALAAENRVRGQAPDSWIRFLVNNGIGAWGFLSIHGPEDLHYRCADHVWIHSPEGEVSYLLDEDWAYRNYRSFLMIPPEFAERAVKAMIMGWIEGL